MFALDDRAVDLHLEPLLGVPQLTGRLAPLPGPGPDGGPVSRPGLVKQQLPAGVERVTGPPLERERRDECPARVQVTQYAA